MRVVITTVNVKYTLIIYTSSTQIHSIPALTVISFWLRCNVLEPGKNGQTGPTGRACNSKYIATYEVVF